MNTAFAGRFKNYARSLNLIGVWIILAVFIEMCLTSCTNPLGNGKYYKPFKMDLDLTRVVLGPQDLSDLFHGATYSINQAIATPQSRGETVTYPTQILPHTTAFADGFLTRIEIFKNTDQALKSFNVLMTQQAGTTLAMNTTGDISRAFMRPSLTPQGFDLDSTEYAILFRERNAVVTIILRTDKKVSSTRLRQLAELVIGRLQP